MFEQLQDNPIVRPLWPLLCAFPSPGLPDAAALNAMGTQLGLRPVSGGGVAIEFEAASQHLRARDYEQRIYRTGKVATRLGNWHDLFNALVWLRFGKLKAALNALHQSADLGMRRSPQRDFATLLDESGVLIACDDMSYANLLRQHQWHTLFWARRQEIEQHMHFFVVGHALYEKALAPYPAMTGKALVLEVPNAFMTNIYATAIVAVDTIAARHLSDPRVVSSPKNLLPLPLLGIPGWSAGQSEGFYKDVRYFRP